MQVQQKKAREDISRYCDALQLPSVAKEEAEQLFAEVAKKSKTRLKCGGVVDNFSSMVLASIHCASLLVCMPRMIRHVLAVADIGAGETKKSVGKALKLLKKTSTRRIPLVDPHHVIKETCRLYLQDLTLSYEQYACSTVDFLKRRVKTCCPDTLGAVALVYAASVASGVCDNAMCQRVAKASGLAASTLRKHVQTTLTPPLLPSS